jgi:hypothetical protein
VPDELTAWLCKFAPSTTLNTQLDNPLHLVCTAAKCIRTALLVADISAAQLHALNVHALILLQKSSEH